MPSSAVVELRLSAVLRLVFTHLRCDDVAVPSEFDKCGATCGVNWTLSLLRRRTGQRSVRVLVSQIGAVGLGSLGCHRLISRTQPAPVTDLHTACGDTAARRGQFSPMRAESHLGRQLSTLLARRNRLSAAVPRMHGILPPLERKSALQHPF